MDALFPPLEKPSMSEYAILCGFLGFFFLEGKKPGHPHKDNVQQVCQLSLTELELYRPIIPIPFPRVPLLDLRFQFPSWWNPLTTQQPADSAALNGLK
jgi:hypothetical protein